MAVGPLVRLLAQIVVPVIGLLARAIPKAYGQALQNARKAGGAAAADAAAKAPIFGKTISHNESLQILNLAERKTLTPEDVSKQFEKYMAANDVSKGGSFYLQSKFYRANELLQQYIAEQQQKTGSTEVPAIPPENTNTNTNDDNDTTMKDERNKDSKRQS